VELAADLNMFESKKFGFFVSAFHKKMIPFFIKRAVGVAYVSKHLAEMYPAGGQSLIASNVNLKSLRNSARNFPDGKEFFKVGFAGALTKRKGIYDIVEAAKILKYEYNFPVQFHLLGGHSEIDWVSFAASNSVSDIFVFHGLISSDLVAGMMEEF